MPFVTLYKINHNFRVTGRMRIMTDRPITPPSKFYDQSAKLSQEHVDWLAKDIMPLLERHNGYEIIYKWTCDHSTLTVAVCLDDLLVAPDLLCNTTSYLSTDVERMVVVHRICKAAEIAEGRKVTTML